MIRIPLGCLLASVILASSAGALPPTMNILETAQPSSELGTGGNALGDTQFMAARFSVSAPTQITSVGGNIGSGPSRESLFAAIVRLSGPGAVPVPGTWPNAQSAFNPQDIVGTTLFTAFPPEVSRHITIPFSRLLEPGHYALVFGSGMFGATAIGYMPENNPVNPGQASLMGWWDTFQDPETGKILWHWNEMPLYPTTMRFVVQGYVVPEPAAAVLFVMALAILQPLFLAGRFSRRR